jgi:hypothetical protein
VWVALVVALPANGMCYNTTAPTWKMRKMSLLREVFSIFAPKLKYSRRFSKKNCFFVPKLKYSRRFSKKKHCFQHFRELFTLTQHFCKSSTVFDKTLHKS